MSTVQFTSENERKYQNIEEIREQYNGYCVCLIRCKESRTGRIFGGEVLAYDRSVAELTGATLHLLDNDDIGAVSFEAFTFSYDPSVVYSGILQAVEV
ncbi:MAG: hypothetical protein FWG87_06820 [Defluviitaleaceae bacterium]|nr:hypothetical protein [Defluviitaleaceae bacterium]